MGKKTKLIAGIIAIVVVLGMGFALYTHHKKVVDIEKHSAPLYTQTGKKTVLLSSSVDKLNKYQENQFYAIANGALNSNVREGIGDKVDDDALYVAKVRGKGRYAVKYWFKWDLGLLGNQKFTASFDVQLKTQDFRKSNTFTTYGFESSLQDFVDEYDPE
jgi:hypothetical protein